ncbi:peptidoglycan-binding protein [Pedobacter heparinus]|uniref:peptidoglycan-binding protein n=1 Tax=Pedobacter heparinus TaxID=984 RepID=UPI000560ABD8|nr:peptidoglycan-binding protein [Pedobacter heparinus]
MAKIGFLLGIVWLAAAGSSWSFGRNIISYEKNNFIEIARSQIGIRETNCENCGVAVKGYLSYVGIKSPAPWCAAFVSWCFGQAGYARPRTAWSPALFPRSRLVTAAKPGIVYGIFFASMKRIGHCGITERLQGDFIVGLEANTSLAGSREGDGVYRKVRHKRSIHRYADWL